MIDMLKRHEIQVLRRSEHTWSEIATLSGVSEKTARRIAAESHVTSVDNAAERARRQVGRPSKADAYRAILLQALTERWTMDFVSARTTDGRWFRALTVVDIYTREALALVADRSLTGLKVAAALSRVLQRRPKPEAISVDNGTEFVSKTMDAWAYAHGVRLDFIRPCRPVENAFIESFNGRLRDECLNSHVFGSVAEAQALLDVWRDDYNRVRPDSALQDRTPMEWAQHVTESREPRDSVSIGNWRIRKGPLH